ncbi:Lon protease [uncultured archaeon]|nr:Lon protease [uncultured archaeon]
MARNTEKKSSKKIVLLSIIIIVALSVLAYQSMIKEPYKYESKINEAGHADGSLAFSGGFQSAILKLPAVNSNDTGVSAYLTVNVKKGTGGIFLDVSNVLTKEDTQNSARMAAAFAEKHENINSNTVDLFYNIRAFAPVIEGPSAGAALTITTIAALKNETPASDVMITGTINHDGTIGPSGKILEKAKAAKEVGARLFLVPVGSVSSLETNYTESEYCQKWGDYEYCQPEFTTKIINVSKAAGIPIVEVATVDEALKYFELK